MVNTIDQLRQLKLSGMSQAFAEQLEQPPLQDLTFNERFALLVDREILHRSNRRLTNLLRQARLRQNALAENVDYAHQRNLNKSQFLSLLSCDFIHKHHNLLVTGPTGCGKSYLSCVVGHQACRNGYCVRYVAVPRFLEELTIARADGSYGRFLNQILKGEPTVADAILDRLLENAHRID